MQLIEVERRDPGVAVVTMNDPDRRNAMTVAMGEALSVTFTELARDETLRAVVLTGSPPAFSAGGDLAMLEEYSQRARDDGFDATRTMRAFYGLFLTVRELPVPVIAAVNGHAVGAGLCVALACDLLLMAEDAKVGLNFARLGLHPGMAGSWLLPRLLGAQRAAELLYTARLASGSEMAEHGMALEALPAQQVLPRANALADDIAASSPLVIRQLKISLRTSETNSLASQLDLEAANQAVNFATRDLREGLTAGRERRTPEFTGE